MAFKFNVQIGIAENFRPFNIGGKPTEDISEKICEQNKICYFKAPCSRLRLAVNAENGRVLGVECNLKNAENFELREIALPDFTDGIVSAEWSYGKLIGGCNYFLSFGSESYRDENRKLLLFGELCDECMVVKINADTYLAVDYDGKIKTVFLQL